MTARTTLKTPDRLAGTSPWRPPTRRAFFGMLGAAAAALAVREPARLALDPREGGDRDRPRRKASQTRWVGHC
jgi:hypothetical protein